MKVAKWGNSLAIRLAVAMVEALQLKEGDDIEVQVADARPFAAEKTPTTMERLESIRKYRGRMPTDFKFDRDEANERG